LGLNELIDSLKKNGQKQIDDIWQAAESEAEILRKQIAEAIADITKIHADKLASACQKSMRAIFSETEVKTRQKKLFAYQNLDQALRNAALKQLPSLRQQKYEKIFVNPDDLQMAAKFFTANSLQPDSAISGGVLAETANGRIVVDNTFEKRLERKWPQILPQIIAELEKHFEKSGTAEKAG
jgi:V/A-type H+-transporting ATPase subunit E